VPFAGDENPVGTFPSDGAYPAFRECVRARRLRRRLDHLDAGRYNAGKLTIRPSKAAIKRVKHRLAVEMRALRGANAAAVLAKINPIVRGWANYYRGSGVVQDLRGPGPLPVATHLQMGVSQPSEQAEGLDISQYYERPLRSLSGTSPARRPRATQPYRMGTMASGHPQSDHQAPCDRPRGQGHGRRGDELAGDGRKRR
jgi:Group II intron, maturase-specific domain